jgi:hypothetical protein
VGRIRSVNALEAVLSPANFALLSLGVLQPLREAIFVNVFDAPGATAGVEQRLMDWIFLSRAANTAKLFFVFFFFRVYEQLFFV